MSVERNLPLVRERKLAILKGDSGECDLQKKAGKLLARERIAQFFDPASFVELDALNADAGVVTGYGLAAGKPVYVYAQDMTVNGGAVSAAHARKVLKVMDLAEKTGCPVVAMLDTAGAKLHEGAEAMNAYAQIASRASSLSGVVPQIALVLGPAGGTASALAGMSDIVIMSGNGRLFVNGPEVTSAVTGKKTDMAKLAGPESSMRSGMAQFVCEKDEEAIALARKLIDMLPTNNLDEAVAPASADVNRDLSFLNFLNEQQDALELIRTLCDDGDALELGHDFAPSMAVALGRIAGTTVGFVATQSGRDEGRLTVYGCKKAARFVEFCDCFSIPVIALVDSVGMKISEVPQGELSRAGAQLLYAMTGATCPRIAVITGSAVGTAYTALASRASNDMVYAWPGAVISDVLPSIAVQMLYEDELKTADDPTAKRAELEEKYCSDVADGVHAALAGAVDDVIEPADTLKVLASAIDMLSGKRADKPARKHGNMPL